MTGAVRIFRLPKTATQSGLAKTNAWVVEFEPGSARQVEPLMGWTSSADTRAQIRLWFESQEDAVAYATRRGLMYSLEAPQERRIRPRAYADNFHHDRLGPWTH